MHPYISCLYKLAVKPEQLPEFEALISKVVAASASCRFAPLRIWSSTALLMLRFTSVSIHLVRST